MSPKRGDRVTVPPPIEEWDIRFGTGDAARGWEELCRLALANTRRCLETLRADPRFGGGHDRQHRLRGDLGTHRHNGIDLEQWEYEVTSGGRVRYAIDDSNRTVWLVYVSPPPQRHRPLTVFDGCRDERYIATPRKMRSQEHRRTDSVGLRRRTFRPGGFAHTANATCVGFGSYHSARTNATRVAGAATGYVLAAKNRHLAPCGPVELIQHRAARPDIDPEDLKSAAVDVAYRMADLCLKVGDTASARWAVAQGCLADPGRATSCMSCRQYHIWHQSGTVAGMATNLRLRPDAEEAVRLEAERTGRSQQEVIREAVDRHLGLSPHEARASELGALIATGTVRPPRTPYRKAAKRIKLPTGVTSADLLDRHDRI